MEPRELIISELRNFCHHDFNLAAAYGFTWDDKTFLRTATIRIQQRDYSAWTDFIRRMERCTELAEAVCHQLVSWDYLYYDYFGDKLMMGLLPPSISPLMPDDADSLISCLLCASTDPQPVLDEPPKEKQGRRSEIMYIEYKGGSLTGPACIGRVTFSQSRKTIYYNDCKFQSLKGDGYKANVRDVANGGWYWISKCRGDGQDTLYPGIVEIDDDVREEYWTKIRNRPDLISTTSYRSEGKYSRRRPHPEKPNHPASGPR